MPPAVSRVFRADLYFALCTKRLGVLAFALSIFEPCRLTDALPRVPGCRIVLERLHHGGQFILQAMLRLPAKRLTCAPRIERVMVIGHGNHERPDKGRFTTVNRIRNGGLKLRLCP